MRAYINGFNLVQKGSSKAFIIEEKLSRVISRFREIYVLSNDPVVRDFCSEKKLRFVHCDLESALLRKTANLVVGSIFFYNPCIFLEEKDIDEMKQIYASSRPSILFTISENGNHDGCAMMLNTSKLKIFDYDLEALLQKNPFPYLVKRGGSINLLEKETEFKDRIGEVEPYLSNPKLLNNLQIDDPELYFKLRDNPERISIIKNAPRGEYCADIGCSDGVITIELAKTGVRKITGYDLRKEAIINSIVLLQKNPELKERVNFEVSTPEELLKKNKRFDTIYFTEVLEHIPFEIHNKVIYELSHLLNPDGNLLITVPNRFVGEQLKKEYRDRWNWGGHVSHFSQSSFEYLLKKHFKKINFIPSTKGYPSSQGIFLIANCYK